MKIKDVYDKYLTPKNLQEHMLRVASLSKIITDNWTGETLDSLAIVKACAMRDISKPINFDTSMEAQEKYGMAPEDVARIDKLKEYIKKNFGTDEHTAAVLICKQEGFGKEVTDILENIEWEYTQRLLKEKNINALVTLYCDMCIGPKGILTMEKRFSDLKARRGADYYEYFEDALKTEKLLQENTNANLKDIKDHDLNSLFDSILNLEI